ncbi:MAG: carbohydrate ABC transporter permease [Spirochaetia bacterium]
MSRKNRGKDEKRFERIGYVFVGIVVILCVIPFYSIIIGSFTEEKEVLTHGYRLIPDQLSIRAYRTIIEDTGKILGRSYFNSIVITTVGTLVGLFFISAAGYVLQHRKFKHANKFAFFFYFCSLFNAGMIPRFLLYANILQLRNTYFVLIFPPMVSVWFIIIMRTFMKTIPYELTEAATIEGASDFRIYTRVILPLSKPGLAAIGLFLGLQYWNNWFSASIYITKEALYPLQYLLYRLLKSSEFLLSDLAAQVNVTLERPPTETIKLATAVIVTMPILALYPFLQKYLMKGLMIGSVKG